MSAVYLSNTPHLITLEEAVKLCKSPFGVHKSVKLSYGSDNETSF